MTILLAILLGGTESNAIDRGNDVYWECDHTLSNPGAGRFRGSISAIVSLSGKVSFSNFRYIDSPTHLHFKAVNSLPEGDYRLNYIYGGNVKLPFAPQQPLWLFHYADSKLIKREINYTNGHVRRKETRPDAFIGSVRNQQVKELESSDKWIVKAVLQDGTTVTEFQRKSVSWQTIRSDQNKLKNWVRTAATDPDKHCWYSSPDTRAERDLSVIN